MVYCSLYLLKQFSSHDYSEVMFLLKVGIMCFLF